jgi:hypothetical protein
MATGQNGELVAVVCPVCGMAKAPGPGTAANKDEVRRSSKDKASGNGINIIALNPDLP